MKDQFGTIDTSSYGPLENITIEITDEITFSGQVK